MVQSYYPGFQPFPISQQQVIPDRSTRPAPPRRVAQPAAQPTIIILPTTQHIPRMPVVPRENHDRRTLPGPRPTPRPISQPIPQPTSWVPPEEPEYIFVPSNTSSPSTDSPRWPSALTRQPHPPQNVVYMAQSPSSSRVSGSTCPSNRGRREASQSRSRILHGSRERDGVHTRRSSSTSRGRRRLSRVPSTVTDVVAPHVTRRSAAAATPPLTPPPPQPVIVAQQPVQPQPIFQQHSTVAPHPPPLAQKQPTLIVPQPVQPPVIFPSSTTATVHPVPALARSVSSMVPLVAAPVPISEPRSAVPVRRAQRRTAAPAPDNVHPPAVPVATPAPLVARRDSSPPRRSRLRKARRPTLHMQPIEPQPVVITRSQSPSSRRKTPLPMPIPVETPEPQPVDSIPAPQVVVMPRASRPGSLRSRRRNLSDDPSPVVIHTAPRVTATHPESHSPVVQPAVVHPSTEAHLVVMPQRPRSSTPPIVLAPQELSSEPPECRSYSTADGGYRSSSPYYRGRSRGYFPYREGSSYSCSRSPSPHSHGFETPPSRSPSRVFSYSPTDIPSTGLPSPPRSIYYSRGSPDLIATPARVEVVNYPRTPSLSRRRTYPRHDEYQYGGTTTRESYRYARGPGSSSISSPSDLSRSRSSVSPGYSDDNEPLTPVATPRRRLSVPRRAVPTPRLLASEQGTESNDWILLDEESGNLEVSAMGLPLTPGQPRPMWKWINNL